MKSLGYVLLFLLIQLVSLVLVVVGVPLVGALAFFRQWRIVEFRELVAEGVTRVTPLWEWKGGKWTWLWSNDEDGVFGYRPRILARWSAFVWSALRNPCNNLRFVRGVSRVGRPLWQWVGNTYYAQAGWNAKGFPVLSAGRNV